MIVVHTERAKQAGETKFGYVDVFMRFMSINVITEIMYTVKNS